MATDKIRCRRTPFNFQKGSKDYLEAQGFAELVGSKNTTRQAFKSGLVEDGEAWMDMITARNLTSHTYQDKIAEEIAGDILSRFHPAFAALEARLAHLAQKEAEGI